VAQPSFQFEQEVKSDPILKMAANENFTPPMGFTLVDERHYGTASILFLRSRSAAWSAA